MFAGQFVDKLTVRLDVPLLEVHARRLGKLGFETVHKCLIIEVEGFGECEATLLAKENLVDAPSAVAVPRRYDVSDQLVHSIQANAIVCLSSMSPMGQLPAPMYTFGLSEWIS